MLGYEFTRWWAYRRIKDPSMRHYIWFAPGVITMLLITAYFLLPIKPRLSGSASIMNSVTQILALVPGFFITALAAISTFSRAEMDETMPDPAPQVGIAHRGQIVVVEVTRRMFLSYLFSYLSILSIALFIVGSVAPLIYPSIIHIAGGFGLDYAPYIVGTLKFSFFVLFIYFLSSLAVTTLHGVYFLCERIHTPLT